MYHRSVDHVKPAVLKPDHQTDLRRHGLCLARLIAPSRRLLRGPSIKSSRPLFSSARRLPYSWGGITSIEAFDEKKYTQANFLYAIGENVMIYEEKAKHRLHREFFLNLTEVYRLNGWILQNIPVAT